MKKLLTLTLTACLSLGFMSGAVAASLEQDIKDLHSYFKKRFPGVKIQDYKNGSYALDEAKATQWESQRAFPPFLDHLEIGESLWNKKFKNGKSFASCFGNVSKVRTRYPFWDSKRKLVRTLEGDIVECQKRNGEKPFGWKKGKIAYLSAYIASQANGQKINVTIPNKDAQAAYEDGREFFYAKRGQLNFSCADCHVYGAGKQARGNLLSPVLGHTTHFPVWRGKWARKTAAKKGEPDGFGTLHRRYGGCNKQVRARPLKAQGTTYRNLEYFHQAMSNGLIIDAPDYRE